MIINYIRRGAYNSFFYALSSGLVRTLNFICLPYLLYHLTLEEFGIWDFYQLIFSYSTLLLSSTAATGMIRFYLLYQNDELKKKQAIGNSLLIALIGAVIFPIVLLIGSQLTAFSLSSIQFFLVSANISFFALFSLVLAYLRMKEKVVVYLLFFCFQNILATLLTLLGISWGYHLQALWFANAASFFIFLPLFLHLWWQHRAYSFTLFKTQASYSIPLVVYSFLYTGLISLDRLYIQKLHGYETLGMYALLWRFGTLFQFIVIALMDAWPILIYNAQKEDNERVLIGQLMRYFCIVLITMGLFTLIASCGGILLFFPLKYQFLVNYLPGFFIQLIFLELARIFQAGFGLSNKTIYIPVLGLGTLVLQALLLNMTHYFGIWGIFLANSITFCLYSGCSYYLSNKIYSTPFSFKCLAKLLAIFLCFCCIIQLCVFTSTFLFCYTLIALCWLIALFKFSIITTEEKANIENSVQNIIMNLFLQLFPPFIQKPKTFLSLLYLRTDLCAHEITAGGSVTHTIGVLDAFQKKGTHLTIASSAIQTVLKNNFPNQFINLKVFPFLFLFRWKLGYARWRLECFFSTFTFALKLRTVIKKNKFDALYQRYSLLNATGVLLSMWYKIPLILEYNGSEVWQFNQLAPRKWFKFNFLARVIETLNLTCAHSIVVVSQALKDDLVAKNIDEEKILVNPNGVDTTLYDPASLTDIRHTIRTELCINHKFVVGFVGTFSFWHGIETIAALIPETIKRCPNIHFLLIGDGMLKSYLMKEIERTHATQYVTLTGLLPAQTARHYLAACDAFICPTQPNRDGTRFFGSPTKLFEYLSMGKPIVASNLEQLSDVISPAILSTQLSMLENNDQVVGVLVEPGDVQHFIDSLCAIAHLSKAEHNAIGDRARLKALNRYSWDEHVSKIEQFTMRNAL